MIRALLCKLPAWIGGGHRYRRLTKKEMDSQWTAMCRLAEGRDSTATAEQWQALHQRRICRRCGAERIAKSHKPKEAT